jgi:hypothetical protein
MGSMAHLQGDPSGQFHALLEMKGRRGPQRPRRRLVKMRYSLELEAPADLQVTLISCGG